MFIAFSLCEEIRAFFALDDSVWISGSSTFVALAVVVALVMVRGRATGAHLELVQHAIKCD